MYRNNISDINNLTLQKRNNYFLINMNEYSEENELLNSVGKLLKNGTDILHVIPYFGFDKISVERMKKLRELCSIYNCLLIINNRLDIARVVEADGVFFDEEGIMIEDIKDISEGLIIGTNQTNCEYADYIITDMAFPNKFRIQKDT